MRLRLPLVLLLVAALPMSATATPEPGPVSTQVEWDFTGMTGDIALRIALEVRAATCELRIELFGDIDGTGADYYFADDRRADGYVLGTDGVTITWGVPGYKEFSYDSNNRQYAVQAMYRFEWEGRQEWIVFGGQILEENPWATGRPFHVSVSCDTAIRNVSAAVDTSPHADFLGPAGGDAFVGRPRAGVHVDEVLDARETTGLTVFRVQQFAPAIDAANLTLRHPDGSETVELQPHVSPTDAMKVRFHGGAGLYELRVSGVVVDMSPTLVFLADFASLD